MLLAEARRSVRARRAQAARQARARRSARCPRVEPQLALSIYRRAKAGFDADARGAAEFKKFVTGTDLFRKQGLVGDALPGASPLFLDVQHHRAAHRRHRRASTSALAPLEKTPGAAHARCARSASPTSTPTSTTTRARAGYDYFPLFMLFVIVLNCAALSIVPHARRLRAHARRLARLTVGYIGVTGGTFTIVSALVPMTILITCTATLVYLHSRFVESTRRQRTSTSTSIFALRNKFARLHRVDVRHRGRLRGAGGLRHPADPPDGHLGRGRPGAHLDHRLHALPGAAEDPARRRREQRAQGRRPVVPAASPTWLPRFSLPLALAAGARRRCSCARWAPSRCSASPGVLAADAARRPTRSSTSTARLAALQGHQAASRS